VDTFSWAATAWGYGVGASSEVSALLDSAAVVTCMRGRVSGKVFDACLGILKPDHLSESLLAGYVRRG